MFFSLVSREANGVADILAERGSRGHVSDQVLKDAPSEVMEFVLHDCFIC